MFRLEASFSSFFAMSILQPSRCLVEIDRVAIPYSDIDPLIALSIAGTIVQFIDLGSKLLLSGIDDDTVDA